MKRFVTSALAAGLAGALLPLPVGPAVAAPADSFGYSATTWATPVRIEIYEPTIPIPATPQLELLFGYTKVISDSTSARGRASFFWPGDAVGEGAKTILENLGLPPELVAPIAAQGYPVQVNSTYPSGPATERDEPFPGTVMRTTAEEDRTVAQNGFSSQCSFDDGTGDSGGGGESPLPGIPGIPGLPELPAPLLELLGVGAPGAQQDATTAAEAEESCQIPAELAALVSVGGYQATSRTERTKAEIESVSTSALGGVQLLGGLIQVSGLTSRSVATSDGSTPAAKGRSSYGTLSVAGQQFTIGPDGVAGGGRSAPIPGLPDDPAKALEELGVTLVVPPPAFERDGKEVISTVEALIVEIDAATLGAALRQLPLEDLLNQLPAEAKDLKKVLQAAINLSPRIVVHLGTSSAQVETAEPITIPGVVPDNDPGGEEADPVSGGGGAGGLGGGLGGAGGTTGAPPPAGTDSTGDGAGTLADAQAASGLPALFTIPTLVFLLALGGALVAGSYVRRMGALALGSGGACSHGLDSGLPDLRKIL